MINLLKRACAFAFYISASQYPSEFVAPGQAPIHIGEHAIVCGNIVQVMYLETGGLLIFDKPYPDYAFSVFLSDSLGARLHRQIWDYMDQRVCVGGEIEARSNTAILW